MSEEELDSDELRSFELRWILLVKFGELLQIKLSRFCGVALRFRWSCLPAAVSSAACCANPSRVL